MKHRNVLLFLSLFLIISCFLVLADNVKANLFYNQKLLKKAKGLSYQTLTGQPSNIFSYESNLKIGIYNYYSKNSQQAEKYFIKAAKLASDSTEKAFSYYWLARSYLMHNEFERAANYFAQTLSYKKNPLPELLLFYGIALYETGQYNDALNCFLNYESQSKTGLQPKELPLFIGASALANGDMVIADQYLDKDELLNNLRYYPMPAYLLGLNYYLAGNKIKSLEVLKTVNTDSSSREIRQRAHLVMGEIYSGRGEMSNAANEFDAIIDDTISKFKEQAYMRSGISYFKQNKLQKAMARFDSLILKYPDSKLNELGFYYKGQIYNQNQKWSKAISEYRKFLANYPKSALAEQTSIYLGRILFDQENYKEASIVYEDFIGNYPKSKNRSEALYNLVQTNIKLGYVEKAQTNGQKFIREFPSSLKITEIRYKLGVLEMNKNDFTSAQRQFRLITDGMYYPYALKELGDINYSLDSLLSALSFYDAAEKVCVDTLIDEVRYNRELVYLKQGTYKSNLDMLKGFLTTFPQSRKAAMVQYEIAQIYLNQGNASQAIIEFDKVRNFDSTLQYKPLAELGMAQGYVLLGKKNEAVEKYLRIVNDFSAVSYLPSIMWSLAVLYDSLQKYDSSFIYYNRLVSEYPKTVQGENSFVELARKYRLFGEINQAIKVLEQYINIYPNSNNLRAAYFDLAAYYQEIGKLTLTEKTLQQIFNKYGKSGDGYDKFGKLYTLQNKYSLAQASFINAHNYYLIEKKTELAALSLFEAGKCAMSLKKWDNAKDLFTRCMNETQDERLRIQCEEQLR